MAKWKNGEIAKSSQPEFLAVVDLSPFRNFSISPFPPLILTPPPLRAHAAVT
jgi:hypothetical protein